MGYSIIMVQCPVCGISLPKDSNHNCVNIEPSKGSTYQWDWSYTLKEPKKYKCFDCGGWFIGGHYCIGKQLKKKEEK